MFHCLMLYYFNVQFFDNVLVTVALVPVTLAVVVRLNLAVFSNCTVLFWTLLMLQCFKDVLVIIKLFTVASIEIIYCFDLLFTITTIYCCTISFSLREKCRHSKLFWSIFSCVLTKYREILPVSLHSVQMWEYTDHNNSN